MLRQYVVDIGNFQDTVGIFESVECFPDLSRVERFIKKASMETRRIIVPKRGGEGRPKRREVDMESELREHWCRVHMSSGHRGQIAYREARNTISWGDVA